MARARCPIATCWGGSECQLADSYVQYASVNEPFARSAVDSLLLARLLKQPLVHMVGYADAPNRARSLDQEVLARVIVT